jgi:ribonuclease E
LLFLEVRKKIYKQAVGSWVRYANQLEPLRQAFLKYVPGLRRKGALVYPDSVNWDCSADWDYAAAEAAAKNEEVYVGESSRSLLGGGDDDDEDEGVEEDDGEAVVKDDNEEEEVEEEEDDDEDEKELIEKKRRRRRKRGGPGRRRKQREEETNSENEDDDSNEGVTERGRGRRRRNRRRGRGREASSRRKNRRAKQENDEEGENEDEEDDSVADVSSSKGKKTALESGPSSKPTNRKDRMEHENRLRAKLAAKETSGKRQKYKGPSIEEMDSRARQLMIKYTINSKGGENEDGEDDVDVDAEAESDTNVAANLYYAALSKKGISPIIVSKMIKSVTADWAHKSINPDIDNVLGMAHLFIHFELLGLAGEMFRDVVSLYRDSGLIVPVDKSSVSHPWSEDTMVQGKNMSPLARAFIGELRCLLLL